VFDYQLTDGGIGDTSPAYECGDSAKSVVNGAVGGRTGEVLQKFKP
jgi:hypothetical protein